MGTEVIKFGDTVKVDGYNGKAHLEFEGKVVGIKKYCYTVEDDKGKEWDVEPSLVNK